MSLNTTHGVGGIKEVTLMGDTYWPSSSQRRAEATGQEVDGAAWQEP